MFLPTLLALILAPAFAQQPNFVLFYLDDMDKTLGSLSALPKMKSWLADGGMTFDNAFVTNPVCCPSRASLFTGLYVHNHVTKNNTVEGDCASAAWNQGGEQRTFPVYLKSLGYTTYHAGKYNNRYALPETGSGTEYIPPGWDHWRTQVGNSQFYNYTISDNGVSEPHGDNYEEDYHTDVIKRSGLAWLKEHDPNLPFLMVFGIPAPHAPFIPAPQYENMFPNTRAPRWPSYNYTPRGHHWFVSEYPRGMTPSQQDAGDAIMRLRLQTLMSTDDLIDEVMTLLEDLSYTENTYAMFLSDHGWHIGQFAMPFDKRTIYDSDLRVPMIVRGPGVMQGSVTPAIGLNIDIAPTLIDLAGGQVPSDMDGRSLRTVLSQGMDPTWRTDFLVEYFGEGAPDGLTPFFNCGPQPLVPDSDSICDTWNNTYACVRTIGDSAKRAAVPLSDDSYHTGPDDLIAEGTAYCYFFPDAWSGSPPNFDAFYDVSVDAYQMVNSRPTTNPQLISQLNARTQQLSVCRGVECH